MRRKIGQVLAEHGKSNFNLYLLIAGVFVLGVVLGTLAVKALDANQEGQLIQYLDWFLSEMSKWQVDSEQVAVQIIFQNIKSILLIAFLGLTVIGAPLILLIVMLKGFVLGFTVGFLVEEKAAAGILISITSILPQNLLNIPAWIIAAVAAVSFSLMLVRGSGRTPKLTGQKFISYLLVMGLLALTATGGAVIETYISPVFLRLVAGYFL